MSGLGEARMPAGRPERMVTTRGDCAPRRAVPPTDAGLSRWALFWRRVSTRKALLRLTDEQLRDIGLTRAEANREAHRPFWML